MIKLRIADKNDAQQLAPIYAYYVENTAISFEYSAPTVEEFESRILHKLEKYPFIVAAENGRCIGYGDHETLMKTCEPYRETYEIQMGDMNE
jgi:phosphinothricin acetyltransferase